MAVHVELKSRIPQVRKEVEEGLARAVAETAFAIEGNAKMLAPVDTGFLRNSINAESQSRLTWFVNVGAHYGIHQEFGTYKMAAQPFLLPAANRQRPLFESRISRALREAAR